MIAKDANIHTIINGGLLIPVPILHGSKIVVHLTGFRIPWIAFPGSYEFHHLGQHV